MAPTTNMNLTLPVVSQTPGPEWASTINSDLSLIDAHDHTSAKGARIPSAALNINDNINFASYSPYQVGYIGFYSQSGTLASNRQLYVNGGDLYYNNGASTPVQITNGSSVAGSTGTITGLPSGTASASYNAGTSTFAFASATNTPAKMDVGPITVRLNSASSYGVTIQPNASISGNWTLTLPATAPGATSLFCGSVGGAMSYVTTDSTLTLSSSLLKVANLGIDTAQLKDLSVTQAKLAAVNTATSASTGNLYTITATPSGIAIPALYTAFSSLSTRPLVISLQNDQSGTASIFGSSNQWRIRIRVIGPVGTFDVAYCSFTPTGGTYVSPSSIQAIHVPVSGVYTIQAYVEGSSVLVFATNMKLNVYQL